MTENFNSFFAAKLRTVVLCGAQGRDKLRITNYEKSLSFIF